MYFRYPISHEIVKPYLMNKSLYFICPTDYLEPVINKTFRHKKYYYASLGNSVSFDCATMREINTLIKNKDVRNISFVLSTSNPIIQDALGNQEFSHLRGVKNVYNEIKKQKEHSKALGQTVDPNFCILSYYLNHKIKELQHELNSVLRNDIKINGVVYNKQENRFTTIYTSLICRKYFSLN